MTFAGALSIHLRQVENSSVMRGTMAPLVMHCGDGEYGAYFGSVSIDINMFSCQRQVT